MATEDKVLNMIERMEARQAREKETPAPEPTQPQQQGIPVPVALASLLQPPREYNVLHILDGIAKVAGLAGYFGMSVPDTCAALSFVINNYNRAGKYKPIEMPVPVPTRPETPARDD